MKIVVGASSFGKASPLPGELLKNKGIELVLNPYGRKLTEKETIDFLKDADGILAGLEPLNRRVLETCGDSLKAISRIGIGMDNVDMDATASLGIAVSNTPDAPTQAVAELTLAAALSLSRRLHTQNLHLHAGKWGKSLGRSLGELSILIVGYGRVGQKVHEYLKPFCPDINIFDPVYNGSSVDSLHEALPKADLVTLHAGGRDLIIGQDEIKLMKLDSMLLNSGRGGQVDEKALAEALKSGSLSGCWLDVFSEEPYNGVLCECEKAILTPHTSSYTVKCRKDMEMQAVENILRDLNVQ